MSIKLSDTQLIMLSAAAQRDDHSLTLPEKLKGGPAQKVAAKLIAAGLVKEVKAKAGMPVWRRDEQDGQSYGPKLTAAGAKAIAVNSDDAAHANDEERSREEQDQSSTFDQSPCTAAAAFVAPRVDSLTTPRSPRVGTKLAKAIELLGVTEGATIAELSQAMHWLLHTTRAVLTGLRKRGYALTLDRSDAERGSVYRIAVDANAAHAAVAPTATEPPIRAPIGGASDSSASFRPAATTPRRSGAARTPRAA